MTISQTIEQHESQRYLSILGKTRHIDLCRELDIPRMYFLTNLPQLLNRGSGKSHLVSQYLHPRIHCHLKAGKDARL